MRALRLSLAAALLLATPALASAQAVSKDASAASASATDPVGNYEWSLQAGDQAYNGTLVVTRGTDGALAASITANSEPNPLKSKSVKVADGRLVVITDTQYGEFTMDVKLGEPLGGKWSVGDGTSNGELKIARKKS
jgi:hypothetical protein